MALGFWTNREERKPAPAEVVEAREAETAAAKAYREAGLALAEQTQQRVAQERAAGIRPGKPPARAAIKEVVRHVYVEGAARPATCTSSFSER